MGYSLVVALFGRPAGKHEDIDLKVAMSTGPGKQGRRAHSASPTPSRTSDEDTSDTSNGPLGKRGLQTMDGAGGIGGFASREKFKKEVHAQNSKAKKEKEMQDWRRKLVEFATAPQPESKSARELCASVAVLTKAVVAKGRLDEEEAAGQRHMRTIDGEERKLKLWEKRGKEGTEDYLALEAELEYLYDNPPCAAVEPLPPVDLVSAAAKPSSVIGDAEAGAAVASVGGGTGVGGSGLPGFSGNVGLPHAAATGDATAVARASGAEAGDISVGSN